ncbi:unnamed protein product [Heterosigma akashiwo]
MRPRDPSKGSENLACIDHERRATRICFSQPPKAYHTKKPRCRHAALSDACKGIYPATHSSMNHAQSIAMGHHCHDPARHSEADTLDSPERRSSVGVEGVL